jgi:hypothetical protein
MNICINIKHPDLVKLAKESGLNPLVLASKMGVWMETNDTMEWPTLEELGISKVTDVTEEISDSNEPLLQPIVSDPIEPSEIHTPSTTEELPLEEDVLTDDLSQLDRIGEIKAKAIKALETKLELEVRRKNLTEEDIDRKKGFVEKLSKLESEEAMILFVKQASQAVSNIVSKYNSKLNKIKSEGLKYSDVITPGVLYQWRDTLSAYDTIEDFRSYLIQEDKLDSIKDIDINGTPLSEILDKTIVSKNAIKDLYETKGIDMVAEYLAPHYNKIYKDFEILSSKKYDKLTDEDKAKISKKDYVASQKRFNNENLRKKTILLLRRELVKANKDINLISRWVENTQDASDPIIAATAKVLGIKTMQSETISIEARDEIVDALRELEKFQGNSTNKKKFYGFMLEKDENGNYTTNTVDRFGSQFWNAYDTYKEEQKSKSYEERRDNLKGWVKVNTIFNREGFNKARWEVIDRLKAEGKLSDIEYKELEWNDISYTPLSAHQMAENNIINEEAANEISNWVFRNIWEYRKPSEKWEAKNTNWKQFEKLLSNPSDPRVNFYNVIKKYEEEAGKYLPGSQRLKAGRLPSIIKSNEERISDKEPIKEITKSVLSKQFNILADDTSRGNPTIQDEQGNEINFIPVHYTGRLDVKDQSFDLASIYLKYFTMAVDHGLKREILPEMEMARFFINNRDIVKTDSSGNPVLKTYRVLEKKVAEKVTKSKGNNQLADQFNDWFDMVMYGKKTVDEGDFNIFGLKFDKAKSVDFLNKFTSLNVLALNYKAGVSNIITGEALQTGEAFAGQHMSKKSYTKANKYFWLHSMGIIEDIGSRKPEGIINKLYEEMHISPEPISLNLKDNTRAKMLSKSSSLFFVMHAGDFYMQSRLFLGMLADKQAYDSEGKEIGTLLDMYSIRDGKLTLDPRVDLEKSNWTKQEQTNFSFKVKGIMSGIHGEYSDIGRSAMQRYALGRMGIMFRKFIVPGVKRRYKKSSYIERLGEYSEGYYRTTGRFFSNLAKELRTMQFLALGSEWNKLTKYEKGNIIKTLSEVVFLIATLILAGIFLAKAKDDDDDELMYSFLAYQALRFKAELLFYTNPAETMALLRSPMATMSTFENLGKLCKQLEKPGELYQRGPWKDHLKMEKIWWDFVPGARAFFQTRDIKSQLNFLK